MNTGNVMITISFCFVFALTLLYRFVRWRQVMQWLLLSFASYLLSSESAFTLSVPEDENAFFLKSESAFSSKSAQRRNHF